MSPINPMAFWADKNDLYNPKDTSGVDSQFNEWLQTPGTATDIGVGQRLAYGTAALGPRTVEGLAMTAGNIGHWLGLTDQTAQPFVPSLPAGKGAFQQGADLAGAIAPVFVEGPAFSGPLSKLSEVTGLAKAAPGISRALVSGGEFAGLAAQSGDPTTTGEQFGEGTASALLSSQLAKGDWRRMLGSAAIGIGSKMFMDRNGAQLMVGDFSQGDIQGTALGLSTALVGHPIPKWSKPTIGELPVKNTDTTLALRPEADPTQRINPKPTGPGMVGPDGVVYGGGPIGPDGRQLSLEGNPTLALPAPAPEPIPPIVPLLHEADLNQFSNKPLDPIMDMATPQSEAQLLNRTPGNVKITPFGYRETPVVIPADGPIRQPVTPVTPERIKEEVLHPENQQLVYNAAFGGIDPELQHQGEIALQALQTEAVANEVRQNNRQQTHDFVSWMHDLQTEPTVSGADNLTKLARSPHISSNDLATEIRSYSPSEREALGRELGVHPDDTMGMADALKDRYDPSRAPRRPPEQKFTDEELNGMLLGDPEFPHLTEGEADVRRGMNKRSPEQASTHIAQLMAGARGVVGGLAGYAYGQSQDMSEGEKWMAAATLGASDMYGPAVFRGIHGKVFGGEAEARIPTWGGPRTQRTALGAEPPARLDNNPRLAELHQGELDRAESKDKTETLQRLQNETTRKGGMTKRQSPFNEGGFRSSELSAAMSRAAVGAAVGGIAGQFADDPGSHKMIATGAVAGALLSMFGPALIRGALAEHSNATKPDQTATPEVGKIFSTTAGAKGQSFAELLSKARLAVDQPVTMGKAPTMMDRALSRFDYWTGTTLGPKWGRLLNQAEGPINFLTKNIDDAFHKISLLDHDQSMTDKTNAYLNGDTSKEVYIKSMATDSKTKAFADFATIARENMLGLKDLIAKGVGNEKRAEMLKTTDNYLTRSFRMFVDKAYTPSVEATNELAAKILKDKDWAETEGGSPNLDQIKTRLSQYVQEIKQNQGVYKSEAGKKIDQSVFGKRKVIDPEWGKFLGEITDPKDRIRLTVLKLKPMAEASNFMHMVANGLTLSDEGLKFAFSSSGEHEAAKQAVLQRLQTTPNDPQLRRQLLELQQYKFVEPDARYGMLQGQTVHRNVYDVMNEWNTADKVDSAAGRALMGINQFMKSNVTYRNPMGIIRQVLSTPFFLMAGRGIGGMGEAWDVMRNPEHPINRELIENGIVGVEQVSRDVLRDVDKLEPGISSRNGEAGAKVFLGRIDHILSKAGAYGQLADSKMAELFKLPDNYNRAAIYLAAKGRIAAKLGLALDSPEVINQAVEHTNRYSMNYSLLPRAVLKGRVVPGINMFISYAAEMGRLLKNMGQDLIGKDTPGDARMNAIMTLSTMIALPEAMQRLSESSLSDEDKKAWKIAKAGMPAYAKDRYMIVMGRDKATGKFRVADISKLLPAQQFQEPVRALTEGRIKDATLNNPVVGFDNNPALNIAGMFMYGEDRVSGRKLRGPTDYIASIAKEVGGPLTPGEGSLMRNYHKAFDINADGTRGITDKRGRTLTPSDFWNDTILQLRTSDIDPKVIQQGIVSQYKQDVANEMAYANDILKSPNQPKEVKDKAMLRTKEALKQIQAKFFAQAGIIRVASSTP